MVDKNRQSEMMRKTEGFLTEGCGSPLARIGSELKTLGFTQKDADPVAAAFEHRDLELYLEIELDNARCVHGYILLPYEEKAKKQRKFRW